jgi:hypothetical protein
VLRDPLDAEAIVRQVQRYDAADAAAVSQYIRDRAGVPDAVTRYLHVYEELMTEPVDVSDSSRELDEYLRHTATSMAQMELELAEYRRPHRMEALSSGACADLRLAIQQCVERALPAAMLDVRVEIVNDNVEEIGSYPPFPMQLSYRWFREGIVEPVVADGRRTALQPPVPPHGNGAYWMKIEAPSEPGRYRLRLTLVQEFVRWLDEVPSFQFAETAIVVASPPSVPGAI